MSSMAQLIGQWRVGRVARLNALIGGLLLAACTAGADAPPSPDLLQTIQSAISASNPEVHRNVKEIPVVVFGNGAKATIAMRKPMTMGSAVFISDPSDNLVFEGAEDKTIYRGGKGAVVLEGKKVFLYQMKVTDEELRPSK